MFGRKTFTGFSSEKRKSGDKDRRDAMDPGFADDEDDAPAGALSLDGLDAPLDPLADASDDAALLNAGTSKRTLSRRQLIGKGFTKRLVAELAQEKVEDAASSGDDSETLASSDISRNGALDAAPDAAASEDMGGDAPMATEESRAEDTRLVLEDGAVIAPGGATASAMAPAPSEPPTARLFQELVALLSRDPDLKSLTIADLEWLVGPALKTRQAATMKLRVSRGGRSVLVPAGAIWASVSADVDAWLASQKLAGARLQINPEDWTSGDQLWLLAVLGPPGVDEAVVAELDKQVFNGKSYKRYRGALMAATQHG